MGEMLDSEAIDGIIVCTPPSSHYEVAKEAILRGKHTLVEKPLTTSPVEARELVELAARMNVILTVGFIERFPTKYSSVLICRRAYHHPTPIIPQA